MIPSAEANGFRHLLQRQPPLGTPPRVLAVQLRRCPHQSSPASLAVHTKAKPNPSSPKMRCETKRFYETTTARAATATAPSQTDSSHGLPQLLDAVKSQNSMQILANLKKLARQQQPEDLRILADLPNATFSELLQCLDPVKIGPKADVTYGLQIQSGLQQFSPLVSLVNKFGIRKLYHNTLQLMRFVLDLRVQSGRDLSLSDYIVLLRCAGAASDIESAKWIWKVAMKPDEKTAHFREALPYGEFMKARFLTEKLYMQNNLATYRVRPRDLSGHRKRFVDKRRLRGLERLRLSIFANSRTHYGRSQNQPMHDMHRVISLWAPARRAMGNMRKSRVARDEAIFCTYMVASARAGSFRALIRMLSRIWGIVTTDLKDHRAAEILGGRDPLRLNPSMRPTLRLMNAVVQSFGSTGHVILARKLMLFISERFDIPIPAETWSSLLEWTYITASRPVSTEWKLVGDPNRIIDAEEVLYVWDMMTAEPYGVTPNFKDMDIRVKSLIQGDRLNEAWDEMRKGCAHYYKICEEVETALFERLYPSPPPEAITRHLRAKARQHTTWYAIERWCHMWLKVGSKRLRYLDVFSSRVVTDFVAEFKPFMPDPITYQTKGGTVRIVDHSAAKRHRWQKQTVKSAPTLARARDLAKPRMQKVQGENGETIEVPVVTKSGEQVYHGKSVALYRWTRRNVRKRLDASFGQREKKLFSRPGPDDQESMEEDVGEVEDDGFEPVSMEESRQSQSSGRLDKSLVMRSLFW
ncbi:hypothetical protein CTRI78_v001178 [Colletotrichum trifolii]|uniref:Uncharacterized protein n=1 Tax=Colletotrichum trifolii TaxID=5466 RepID=A0A4R8RQ92_COLTR|nr:hypothetical protein CTRI78_v001178 [Colletotrichum trifolii]